MATDDVSNDVRTFIHQYISSVGHLEVLLLLFREPGKHWTAEGVSQELRTNPSYAEAQLGQLTHSGLLQAQDKSTREYYFPVDCDQKQLVETLANLYTIRRTTIVNIIYTPPVDKIRGFADAFNFRKG